jgi:hypothetical protein
MRLIPPVERIDELTKYKPPKSREEKFEENKKSFKHFLDKAVTKNRPSK